MFDIHMDIWSLSFHLILQINHIHFNLVPTFAIEPKQANVENVNRFIKTHLFSIEYSVLTGSNNSSC